MNFDAADRRAYRFDEMGEGEANLAKCYRAVRRENATLRSDLAKARALAIELGRCKLCRTDVARECFNCSGTGLDPRVPKEWLTERTES